MPGAFVQNKEDKDGPSKECPFCHMFVHNQVSECPNCKTAFPTRFRKERHTRKEYKKLAYGEDN